MSEQEPTHSYVYVIVKNQSNDLYLIYAPTNKYYEKDYFSIPLVEVEVDESLEEAVGAFLESKGLTTGEIIELIKQSTLTHSMREEGGIHGYNSVCVLAKVEESGDFNPKGDHAHGSFVSFHDLKEKLMRSPACDEVTQLGLVELEKQADLEHYSH